MKHAPHVVSASRLADIAIDQRNDAGDFPDVLDADGDMLPEVNGKWFVVQWPENCVTEQFLGDASIHGPFDTEQRASDFATSETVNLQIAELLHAAGNAAASKSNPCGVLAYHDAAQANPWRMADDWHSETFATFEEALESAKSWGND